MENISTLTNTYCIKLLVIYIDNVQMGTELDKLIGARLKFFRCNAGYTQEQIAELVDCEISTIGHCENGKSRISITLLSKIADVLDVELYKFLTKREFETDPKTISAINELLKEANKSQLGLIYSTISNILDLT